MVTNDIEGPQTQILRSGFDAEYPQNGCKYVHSYYGRRIGNRTRLSNCTTFNDLE